MVETKTNTHEELAKDMGFTPGMDPVDTVYDPVYARFIDKTDAIVNLYLWSFLNQAQGLEERRMIGNSIYMRYLKAKFCFTMPVNQYTIKHPCDMYLIHGWITAPCQNTLHTPIVVSSFTRQNLLDHINAHVKQYFNNKADNLRFIPKETTSFKIEGYRKIKPNRKHSLGQLPNVVNTTLATGIVATNQTVGAVEPIRMSCTWKVNRKIAYTSGNAQASNFPFLYPNNSWIPFVVVYNPSYESFDPLLTGDTGYLPTVAYNNSVWFSDS